MKGTARLILVWGTGRLESSIGSPEEIDSAEGALSVVLEHADHLDQARSCGIVGPNTRVFVPGAFDSAEGPIVMGYDGVLNDPGADVQIGPQFFLQTQDYGTSEYLSLIGATLVKIVDERDFQAFLSDADAALDTGTFAEFATHPMVRICDVSSLGVPPLADEPRLRLHVRGNGEISTSASGSPIGELGDALPSLIAMWNKINDDSPLPCSVGLAQAVDDAKRVAELRERPWLARYHGALAGIRNLRARDVADGREISVSGFGARLSPDLADVDKPWDLDRPTAPLLLWTAGSAYVYSPAEDRTFQLSLSAGAVAEQLLVHGSMQAAGEVGDAGQLTKVREFFANVGVSLGE